MEYFTEETLFKVFDALRKTMTEEQAREAINNMQNEGILFRERKPGTSAPVMRETSGRL